MTTKKHLLPPKGEETHFQLGSSKEYATRDVIYHPQSNNRITTKGVYHMLVIGFLIVTFVAPFTDALTDARRTVPLTVPHRTSEDPLDPCKAGKKVTNVLVFFHKKYIENQGVFGKRRWEKLPVWTDPYYFHTFQSLS